MSDHKQIYLEPECCADPYEGRQWCNTDSPVDCEDGVKWTRYVLGSDHDALKARLAEASVKVNNVAECLANHMNREDCIKELRLLAAVMGYDAARAADSAPAVPDPRCVICGHLEKDHVPYEGQTVCPDTVPTVTVTPDSEAAR